MLLLEGGDGSAHFRREKYVPKGGPDGGDGGKGGDVVLVGRQQLNTLLDFRYKKFIKSNKGENGAGTRKTGSSGVDIRLEVPLELLPSMQILKNEWVKLPRKGELVIAKVVKAV